MALIPTSIGQTLGDIGGGIGEIFTNVKDAVQTVDSVYDQLTGQSQNVPAQTTPAAIKQATTTQASVPATVGGFPTRTIVIGAGVLLLAIVILR